LAIRDAVARTQTVIKGAAAAAIIAGAVFAFGGNAFAASCFNQLNSVINNWGISVSGYWTVNNGTISYGNTSYGEYAIYPLSWEGTYSGWAYQGSTSGEAQATGLLVESVAGVIIAESTQSVYCNATA